METENCDLLANHFWRRNKEAITIEKMTNGARLSMAARAARHAAMPRLLCGFQRINGSNYEASWYVSVARHRAWRRQLSVNNEKEASINDGPSMFENFFW